VNSKVVESLCFDDAQEFQVRTRLVLRNGAPWGEKEEGKEELGGVNTGRRAVNWVVEQLPLGYPQETLWFPGEQGWSDG
jgi:hypothetical protein